MKTIEAIQKAVIIAEVADDMKAEDIVVLDLHGISEVTEYFLICTVQNARQLRALWSRVRMRLKKDGELPFGEEVDSDRWILGDYNDVVVHVFLEEFREFYDLELLWGDAPRVDWQAELQNKK